MTFKKRLIPLFVILLIIASAYFGVSAKNNKAEAVKVAQNADSPQELGIGALGRIEPRSRVVRLSHDQGPEGALIQKLLVKEGQDVKEGDIIVIFSDHDRRESEIAIAKARLDAAKARQASVQAELDDAQNEYRRVSNLIKTSAISQSKFDEAQTRLSKAKSNLDASFYDITAADADWKLAQQKFEQSFVKAPFSGTILKIYAWPGERITDRRIADLADLTQLDVVAEIYENDMARIAIKQKARITLPGNSKVYEAEVRERGFLVQKNDQNDTDPLADRDNRIVETRLTLFGDAIPDLRNQIYRQVQVQIIPW